MSASTIQDTIINDSKDNWVGGSRFLLFLLEDGTASIWDNDYINTADPLALHPPSPIVATRLTVEEAIDWITEALGVDRAHLPIKMIY